jgi:acyl carrier protein
VIVNMSKDECASLICEIYGQFIPPGRSAGDVTSETRLFGGDSLLDSTALVSLLVEVEQQVNDACSSEIVIADDRAMSQKRSPFRTIASLAEYVAMLLGERPDAA